MDKIYNLTIDTKRKSYSKVLGIKQNENNVVLNITLVQNSIALDLTDCTVRLNYLNNNNILLQMADIVEVKEGKVKVNVLTKVLKDIGETPVDISIFDKDNRKITSATFTIVVQASIYTNDVLTKEDMDLVQTIHVNEEERQLKEETRQKNEQERIESENNRESKEKERQEAELKRDTAEKDRSNAETKRITSEEQRVEEETNRIEAEVKRVATENKRVIAETERDTIEKERIAAEKDRVEKEDQRIDNEKSRISQEITRIEQENSRKIQEKDRIDKEKQRVASEIERLDNETIRQKNEKERIANEDTRKDNEGKREVKETDRVTSMKKIIEDWEKLKEELHNLEGGGDMMKAIYDTNKNGVVDDSEKLGGKAPDEYIQKQNKTTWAQLNVQDKNSSGITPHLSFNRPSVDDEIQLAPFTSNFTNLDNILHRMGADELPVLRDIYIDSLKTPGRYLVYKLLDAPDIPPLTDRLYIIDVSHAKTEESNFSYDNFFYRVESLGTGKSYTYMNKQYIEIPTASSKQPSDIFIDAKNGDDGNDGSRYKPIRSWKCLVSRIPRVFTKPLTITLLSDINDPVTLCNYRYSGENISATKLIIQGQGHFLNTLELANNNLTGATYGIHLIHVKFIRIRCYECSSTFIANCISDMIISEHTPVHCVSCEVGEYVADNDSVMIVNGHKTPEKLFSYGCVSNYGSLIYVQGSKPTGSNGDKLTGTGGRVEYED